jgi:hypothetical protein
MAAMAVRSWRAIVATCAGTPCVGARRAGTSGVCRQRLLSALSDTMFRRCPLRVARAGRDDDRTMRPLDRNSRTRRCWRAAMLMMCALAVCGSAAALSGAAGALRERHDAMRDAFATSPFQRPLVLRSSESDEVLKGDVYAVVEHPFAVTAGALQNRARWCEMLILHLNIKDCHPDNGARGETLSVVIGRKFDRSPEAGQPMEFAFRVTDSTADYLHVQMAADNGPFGTRDHRLVVEAAPLNQHSSIVHLTYAHSYGTVARMATQAHLATAGRNKVGFTIEGQSSDGKPVYIGGVRGMVERNVMRYYLAIEAYLGALSAPPDQRTERRLHAWFAATERNPVQLHEMERDEYLAMKRVAVQRVQ